MKQSYLQPEVEAIFVELEQNLMNDSTKLSGSRGENVGGKNSYNDEWDY